MLALMQWGSRSSHPGYPWRDCAVDPGGLPLSKSAARLGLEAGPLTSHITTKVVQRPLGQCPSCSPPLTLKAPAALSLFLPSISPCSVLRCDQVPSWGRSEGWAEPSSLVLSCHWEESNRGRWWEGGGTYEGRSTASIPSSDRAASSSAREGWRARDRTPSWDIWGPSQQFKWGHMRTQQLHLGKAYSLRLVMVSPVAHCVVRE